MNAILSDREIVKEIPRVKSAEDWLDRQVDLMVPGGRSRSAPAVRKKLKELSGPFLTNRKQPKADQR